MQSRCNDFIEAHTEHLLECLHILQIWVESICRSLLQLSNFFLTVLLGCFKSLASYSLGLQNGPHWAGPYTVISLRQVSYDVNALLTLSPGDYVRWGSSHNTKDQHRLLQTVVVDPCLLCAFAPLVLCYIIMVSTYQQKGGHKCIMELSSVSLALHAGNFVLNLITIFEFKM